MSSYGVLTISHVIISFNRSIGTEDALYAGIEEALVTATEVYTRAVCTVGHLYGRTLLVRGRFEKKKKNTEEKPDEVKAASAALTVLCWREWVDP